MPASPAPSQTLGAGESFNYCHYDLEISARWQTLRPEAVYLHRAPASAEVEERGEKGMKTNIPSRKPQITLRLRVTTECDAKEKA